MFHTEGKLDDEQIFIKRKQSIKAWGVEGWDGGVEQARERMERETVARACDMCRLVTQREFLVESPGCVYIVMKPKGDYVNTHVGF